MKLTRSSRVVVASPSLGKLVLDGPGSLEDLEGPLLEDLEGPLLEDLLSAGGILSAIAAASDSDAVRALPNLSLDELDKSCSLEEPLSLVELDELESEELDELESRSFEELDELDELRFFEGFEDSLSLDEESCTLSSPSDEL
jgi:hypothetical protein